MKKLLFAFYMITVLYSNNGIADIKIWDKTFGGSGIDHIASILQTIDGGFIMVGMTDSKGKGDSDAWIIGLDRNGNIIWDKTYGGKRWDRAISFYQTEKSGYIVVGSTESKGNGEADGWVLKLDNSGNKLWDKTVGGKKYDLLNSIIQTFDFGYIATGHTESKGTNNSAGWVVKLDKKGRILWEKTYGGNGDAIDSANSIIQTEDGNYVIAGDINSKAWVSKIDTKGNTIWEKTYGNMDWSSFKQIRKIKNGTFIAAGNTGKGPGNSDAWVVNLDNKGNKLWEKTVGGDDTDVLNTFQKTNDEALIFAGWSKSNEIDAADAWIFKLDIKGNLLWVEFFGESDWEDATSIIQIQDNSYIFTGWTTSKGMGNEDVWLVRFKK
jgi:hypothetical protein